MRKRKTKSLKSARSPRAPRVQSEELEKALRVVNGEVYLPERFDDARKDILKILSGLVEYCDGIDEALAGVNYGKTADECMDTASKIAAALLPLFDRFPKKFEVFVIPRREHQPDMAFPVEFSKQIKEATQAGLARYRTDFLPPREDFFRLKGPLVFPAGDVQEWVYWNFIQGIGQLDDFRRLRKCFNDLNHTTPYYFLTTKVQRQERYFCSDDCRRHYHNNKSIETKNTEREHGRQRPRKTKK